jgi:RND superfamily putative drug exporter
VGRPSPPIPSEDGKALQVVVPLDGTDGDAIITSVEAMRESVRSADGLDVYVAGIAGLNADLFVAFEGIDTTLLLATATVVIVILLLVYRSPVLWLLPLLSAGLAYSAAAGIIYVLAKNDVLTLNGQSQGILTVLVFGAGTDYALLLIARYREELHRFESKYDAMRAAMRSAFPAIAASAATVIAGLLCLLVSELNSNRGLGPVSAIGIAAAFVTMTTFLPALLLLCGRRVFWPRVPRHDELSPTETGVWAGVARGVGARPRRVWVATSLVLVALAAGMTQLRSDGIATTESFTNDVESVAGQEVLARHFAAGSGSPAVVVGSASAAGPLLASVRNAPGVADAAFLTDETGAPSPDAPPKTVDGRVIVQATLAAPPDSPQAQETVRSLREVVRGVAGRTRSSAGSPR